jgi:predicted ATPase
VGRAIAEALGLLDLTAADLPRRVRAACDGTVTLLVLDNCEQVLDAAPLIASLLTGVATLRVLATSRAPLRIRGEREFTVGPLALHAGEGDAAGAAGAAPAIRLFVDRVRDVAPQFRLTAANEAAVNAICRRLDALPLALELAAPWLKVLTPDNLLQRLADDGLLLTVGARDLPERQRTMNATVAWSYQLLSAEERRVFRRLGALPERFPIEAVSAVVAGRGGPVLPEDDLLAATAGLIDKSLLLRTDTSVAARPLYRMLETVRAYAAQELAASGEREDALDGLAHYAVTEGSRATEGLVGPAQGEWLSRVRGDLETYRAALEWLMVRERADDAADIVLGLFFFWVIRGHGREGVAWAERILELPALSPGAQSRALTAAGGLQFTQGDLDDGHASLTRALAAPPEPRDADWRPLALMMLGHIEHARGDKTAARLQFGHFLEASRRLDSPWRMGNALSALAWVALTSGDLAQTDARLEEVTPLLPGTGAWFRLLPLYVRAILAVRRHDGTEAMATVRESLVLIKELQDKFAFVYSLVPLATVAIWLGDDLWAAQILGARDAVAESTGAAVVDASVHELREQLERDARARLGPQQWARAYAAGRTASLDSLVKDIDARAGVVAARLSLSGA